MSVNSREGQSGLSSLSHGNRGRKPANAFNEASVKTVLQKGTEDYKEASLSHMADLLERNDGLKISAKSVGRILKSAGVHNPHKRKTRKRYKSRARRERTGELVQIDASPFDWFETGESYSLHGAIDDATSEILALRMELKERVKEGAKKAKVSSREPASPSENHPWRTSWKEKPFKRQYYDDLDYMEYDDMPLIIGGVRVS